MIFDEDFRQKVYSTLQFFLETYKVFIASLLCIFVPQRCPNQPDNICTLNDNLTDLDTYNMACVIINFITLSFFLVLYVYEYRRERWCIEFLDVDEKKLDDYLYKEIEEYTEFKDRIYKFNHRYWIMTIVVILFNITNILLSGILILKFYYLDYRSVTVFFTNSILTLDRLSNCYNVSNVSNDPTNNLLAISSYMSKPVVFNTIDEDYNKEKEMNMILARVVIKEKEKEKEKEEKDENKKHIRFEKNKIKLLAEKYSKRC